MASFASASGAAAAAADAPEEDVSLLHFGPGFSSDVHFLPNSHVSLLLSQISEKKYGGGGGERRAPEVFSKARAYAGRFIGAVDISDVAAIDELFHALRALEFPREGGGAGGDEEEAGGEPVQPHTVKLHEYQILAISNLNPPSVAAARALIPKLDGFSDDEINEILTTLRRSSARSQVRAAAGCAARCNLGRGGAVTLPSTPHLLSRRLGWLIWAAWAPPPRLPNEREPCTRSISARLSLTLDQSRRIAQSYAFRQ